MTNALKFDARFKSKICSISTNKNTVKARIYYGYKLLLNNGK